MFSVEGNNAVESLLDQGLLWRTRDRRKASKRPHWSTGFSALDAILPDQGWPMGEMVELLIERLYHGEILLLLPLLSRISQQQHVAWVNPPSIPYPVALQQWGIDLSRVLWVQARSDEESIWAAEQLAASGHLGSLLFWPGKLSYVHSRRLQLAAANGSCCVFILRTLEHRDASSGAALRLTLQAASSDQIHPCLNIRIIKGRSSIQRQTHLQLSAYA